MTGLSGLLAAASRWLGTTKNLAGSGLAAAGLIAHLTLGLGPFWPAVLAGLYAVGVLLAPPDKVDLTTVLGTGTDIRRLRDDLGALTARLARSRNRLEADVHARVDAITTALAEILQRGDALTGATAQLHTVEATIHDYLPTSLETYLNMPRTYAMSSRAAGKKSAHDELIGQLDILSAEVSRIRDAVYDNDANALSDQGRFLADKFRTSSLDL